MKTSKNMASSIQARLTNQMKQTGRPYMEILQHFAMERFLYRLSISSYRNEFVLKGGYMLLALRAPESRPTMDIDLLGKTKKTIPEMISIVQQICSLPAPDDGVIFDPKSVSGAQIMEGNEVDGVRIECEGRLGTTHLFIYLDIGFDDSVHPEPIAIQLVSDLGFPATQLLGYTKESIVAEKLEAIVRHGELNTRLKDFFDIWMLSRNYDFESSVLAKAIKNVFKSRNRAISEHSVAFTSTFAQDKDRQKQWTSFIKKRSIHGAPAEFSIVAYQVTQFIRPLLLAIVEKDTRISLWKFSDNSWTS